MKKTHLPLHEWFIVLFILALISSLALISWISSKGAEKKISELLPQKEHVKEITVQIDGEVRYPGTYKFPAGVPLKRMLKKVCLLKYANISEFDCNKRFFYSCQILIPKLEKITVFITGAVKNPGPLELPLGSRFKDLQNQVILTEEVRSKEAIFKSNRYLKQGEVIEICLAKEKK